MVAEGVCLCHKVVLTTNPSHGLSCIYIVVALQPDRRVISTPYLPLCTSWHHLRAATYNLKAVMVA
jgi:hypothetical protein